MDQHNSTRGIAPALLLAAQCLYASVIVSSVSQQELSVGDRVQFSVSAIVQKGATVTPPDPAAAFGAVTVKEWNTKKHELPQADSVVFNYIVTTYKAENCTIPALSYVVTSPSATDTLQTVPAPLAVIPLCTSDTLDIQDLKPQQTAGKRPLLWLWVLIVLLLLTAGAIAGHRLWRSFRKPLPPPPPKPPYDEAIEALNALEAKQYLSKGMVREQVFELSDILKRYIERRFSTNAAEFTTEEMIAWIGIAPLDKSLKNSLEWFFRTADPVKFAKLYPDQKTIDRFGPEARGFVEATKPAETPNTEAAAKPNTAGGKQ